MSELFLSASIPVLGRGRYYETADPFLIQVAVRELVTAVARRLTIVWGGHPAITPMVWAICEDLDVNYSQAVVLYQSRFFEDRYPEENEHFKNTVYVDAVSGDREASLRSMREQMLSRPALAAAVFIGGMDGVEREYELFSTYHPDSKIILVGSTGGAARELALQKGGDSVLGFDDVDFAHLFRSRLELVDDRDS